MPDVTVFELILLYPYIVLIVLYAHVETVLPPPSD